jgi:4-hydroxy-2-oxoglutarate aldolase
MASAGVGPLLAGSMGEAIHLSHIERSTLIKTARKVLDNAGLFSVPIVAGIGAGSTRECIELAKEAAGAGADCAIAICSGYFAGALAGNRKALKAYWVEISQKSPIPVMIYNCEHVTLLCTGYAADYTTFVFQTLEQLEEST